VRGVKVHEYCILPLTEFANVRKNFSHCKFSSPARGEV
jgi:hypothetical protein